MTASKTRLETITAAILANSAAREPWLDYIAYAEEVGQPEWAALARRCLYIQHGAGRFLFCQAHAQQWPLAEELVLATPPLVRGMARMLVS